ncbi:MAG: DUF1385 domain-containing protein [Oscillospiraceae bacterium]|nr:DUF1385 domain-containing protein [Oscillospiraceae bacterium]
MSKCKDNNECGKELRKSKIGGQALIEGIMMKGVYNSAMACRLPDGTIDVEVWENKYGKNMPWYRKAPFIRGSVNMVTQLIEGYKCLMKSADKQFNEDLEFFIEWYKKNKVTKMERSAAIDAFKGYLISKKRDVEGLDIEALYDKYLEDMENYQYEEPSKLDIWLTEKLGDKIMPVISVISIVLSLIICVALFKFLPSTIGNLVRMLIDNEIVVAIAEGFSKIAIFIAYLALTALMKDIRITYEYHGAEHKTIACLEAGEELTVENIKKHSRFHPRCGTSFIFIALITSIIVFIILFSILPEISLGSSILNTLARVGIQIIFLPFIVGISYELIRLAGTHTNAFTKILSAPGLAIQRITTREPSDKQIEVAIAAIKPCIPENLEDDQW